jgi:hypothetical protein
LRPCGFPWHIPAEAIWALKVWLFIFVRINKNSRTLKTDSYNLIEENGAKILFCIFGWVTKGKNIKIENVTE